MKSVPRTDEIAPLGRLRCPLRDNIKTKKELLRFRNSSFFMENTDCPAPVGTPLAGVPLCRSEIFHRVGTDALGGPQWRIGMIAYGRKTEDFSTAKQTERPPGRSLRRCMAIGGTQGTVLLSHTAAKNIRPLFFHKGRYFHFASSIFRTVSPLTSSRNAVIYSENAHLSYP